MTDPKPDPATSAAAEAAALGTVIYLEEWSAFPAARAEKETADLMRDRSAAIVAAERPDAP